jgi:FkbM family methyltransferase
MAVRARRGRDRARRAGVSYGTRVLSSLKQLARRVLPHSLYRRYRQRKIAHEIAGYAPREVSHEYGGQTLRVRLEDPLAEGWYDHDWQEPAVMGFLRERGVLAADATIFDLGAHQAVVALMLARSVGAAGRVIAVEAEPHNARVAAINRDLNDAANLTVIHAAGAASEGFTSFAEGLNGQVDEQTASGNVTVATVTIDGLARDYGTPDLVFVDVEGYEGHVLDGAAETLANGHTSFLVEVHDPETLAAFGASPAAIAERLAGFERYIAIDDDQPFEALAGPPPAGRFFLAAIASQHAAQALGPPAGAQAAADG